MTTIIVNEKINFDSLAAAIAQKLSVSFFDNASPAIIFDSNAYPLIFIRETSEYFLYVDIDAFTSNRKALAYLLSMGGDGKKVSADYIKRVLSCRLDSPDHNEILFYYSASAFVLPSWNWISSREQIARKRAESLKIKEEEEVQQMVKKRIEKLRLYER